MIVILFLFILGCAVQLELAETHAVSDNFALSPGNFQGWHGWCEKVQKFSVRKEHAPWADKHAVKALVKKYAPGLQYADELAFVAEPQLINTDFIHKLKKPYLMKANHMSGGLILVTETIERCLRSPCIKRGESEPLDGYLRRSCEMFSANSYGWEKNEKWYSWIPRKCIFEEAVPNLLSSTFRDYKVWFMLNRIVLVQIDSDRHTEHKRDYVTRDWVNIPMYETGSKKHPKAGSLGVKPYYWDSMLAAAESMAHNIDLPYVRVDFFGFEQGYIFAEITFAHESCNRGKVGFEPMEAEEFYLQLQLDSDKDPDGIFDVLKIRTQV